MSGSPVENWTVLIGKKKYGMGMEELILSLRNNNVQYNLGDSLHLSEH